MEIKPDKKLITKSFLIVFTFTVVLLLAGLILQITVPLGEATSDEVAQILWPIVLGLIILLWLISTPIIILWIKNLSYSIQEDRIVVFKGILTKVQQNIPYRAITDFMLHRSLYDRFLGIASIKIQTAGQSTGAVGYEGVLAGLINYSSLLVELQSRIKTLQPQTRLTGKPDDTSALLNERYLAVIIEELREIRKALERR
jgi:uncharacterized membrane protein YdbT with pleckstrin-like domain